MPPGRRCLLGLAALSLTTPGLAAPRKPAQPPNITVETHRGKVRGGLDDGIKVFKGIPYAAATGGPNRFRPAKPVPVWSGVRDALAYGPMCPQLPRRLASYTESWTYDTVAGEDCLVLTSGPRRCTTSASGR